MENSLHFIWMRWHDLACQNEKDSIPIKMPVQLFLFFLFYSIHLHYVCTVSVDGWFVTGSNLADVCQPILNMPMIYIDGLWFDRVVLQLSGITYIQFIWKCAIYSVIDGKNLDFASFYSISMQFVYLERFKL